MANVVLFSVASLTAMGAVFGFILAIAAKRFSVAKDARVEQIEGLLPGANCGGCGFPGCFGFAKALAEGRASPSACAPSTADTASRIAHVLGVDIGEKTPMVAVIGCGGGGRVKPKIDYRGITTCTALVLLCDNLRECSYGCVGLGTCVEACPFGAIRMVDGRAVADDSACTGCGKCIEACPKGIIRLVPRPKKVRVLCSSHDKGRAVKAICEVGCIACGICAKSCPVSCIEIRDNLAVIDHEKCINCGVCAAKCPTSSIVDRVAVRPRAFIGTSCTGCGECIKACPLKAIEGEPATRHAVVQEKCIGCGLCIDVCKERAITIAGALGHHPER